MIEINNDNIKYYLGVDWGEKRIGLATADSDVKLSLPYKTVSDISELIAVIDQEYINVVVIGEPVKMMGAQSDNLQWLEFVDKLKQIPGLEVVLVDERLTSLAADALVGSKRQKAARDEISASIILQNYLDKESNGGNS